MEQTDFAWALRLLKQGKKVARSGWYGKGMWLVLVAGTPNVEQPPHTAYGQAGLVKTDILPHIDMHTAQGQMCVGWLASQTDMLAEDWVLV